MWHDEKLCREDKRFAVTGWFLIGICLGVSLRSIVRRIVRW